MNTHKLTNKQKRHQQPTDFLSTSLRPYLSLFVWGGRRIVGERRASLREEGSGGDITWRKAGMFPTWDRRL